MTHAGTPIPGEDPGALVEDPGRLDEIEPAGEGIEDGPRPAPAAPGGDGREDDDGDVQPA